MSEVSVSFNTDEVTDEYSKAVEGAVKTAAILVEGAAKRNCPVDTGRLRGSITNEVVAGRDGILGRVGSNVDYSRFVELGTSKMSPQPYLRPALRNNQSKVEAIIQEAIE